MDVILSVLQCNLQMYIFYIVPVNIGQASFEAIAQVVKRVGLIVETKNDMHGRNGLLTSYIEYSCTLPHPEPTQPGELEPLFL